MKLMKFAFASWIGCHALLLTAQSSTKNVPQAQTQTQTRDSAEQPNVYHPGGDITTPKLLHSIDPSYTNEARRKKLSGTTILSIVVDTDGKPKDIQVVRSLGEEYTGDYRSAAEGLDRSAVKAVEKYRFQPSTLNGKAVPVSIKIEVSFQL